MISAIIPVGGADPGGKRKRNFLELLYCIRQQRYRNFEIVLVEEFFGKPMYKGVKGVRHIPLKAPGRLYNLAWARNVGARAAKGGKHLQLDGDIIFNRNYFGKVAKFDAAAFSAWGKMYRLTERGVKAWLRRRSFKDVQGRPKIVDPREARKHVKYRLRPLRPAPYHTAGVAYCFDCDFFFKRFGGFNENFFGWGGMDNDAALRFVRLVGKHHKLHDCTIYHLSHGGRVTGERGRELWALTKKNPLWVSRKLVAAGLGKRSGPNPVRLRKPVRRKKPRRKRR